MQVPQRYKDRFDAARQLVKPLRKFSRQKDAVLLAIPRGALQIGQYLSRELKLPLDVILVKKLPVPESQELAVGAVASDGGQVVDKKMAREYGIAPEYLRAERDRLLAALHQKEKMYREEVPPVSLKNKIIILVDDGIATGQTVQAAVEYLRRQQVGWVVVATPTASSDAAELLKKITDEFISLLTEKIFYAVGTYYVNFPQVEDAEAVALLKQARKDVPL